MSQSITFLGLGTMGSAIARKALDAGFSVTVWNRTAAKAEQLVPFGAAATGNVAQAIQQSPLIVCCMTDYAAVRSVLDQKGILEQLNDRTVVNLTTGSPIEATNLASLAKGAGASYLDGAMEFYVDQVGSPDITLLASGDEEAFEFAKALLEQLSPRTIYLGPNPAQAAAMDSALLSCAVGLLLGAINGAAIFESVGGDVSRFAEILPPNLKVDLEGTVSYVQKIANDHPGEGDTHIRGWGAITRPMVDTLTAGGYSSEISSCFQGVFNRAVEAGLGEEDPAALIKLLRTRGESAGP